MKSRGISGFGVIIILLLLLVLGFVGYQIARVHFTYGKIEGTVEATAEIGHSTTDHAIIDQLITGAKELNVVLYPESIFIDRSIADSFRIYVAYDDSSNIFGLFTYKRHFVVDKVVQTKVLR